MRTGRLSRQAVSPLTATLVAVVLASTACTNAGDEVATPSPSTPSSVASAPDMAGMCAQGATECDDVLEVPSGAPTVPPGDVPVDGTADGAGTCLRGATECADDPSTEGPPAPDEGTPVEEQSDLLEVEATPWNSVRPVDDDQTVLEVLWFGGDANCSGLDRVEVEESETAITITVFTGRVPDGEDCMVDAGPTSTEIELSEPLGPRSILDGAQG